MKIMYEHDYMIPTWSNTPTKLKNEDLYSDLFIELNSGRFKSQQCQ